MDQTGWKVETVKKNLGEYYIPTCTLAWTTAYTLAHQIAIRETIQPLCKNGSL